MTENGNNLLGSGNVTNPRHFIYLDRNRLFSYTAQVSDGLPQVRHFLESINESTIDNPIENYREEVREFSNEGEGSLGSKGFVGAVTGKRNNKKSQKKSFKEGGSTVKFESLQTLSQDKAEHDNLYLVLEKDLIDAGLLHEVVKGGSFPEPCPPLVKITGVARFFDWESVIKMLEQPDILWSSFDQQARLVWGNDKNKLKAIAQLTRTFYMGPLTISMQVNGLNLCASLEPNHLSMTLNQLRAGYVLSGDVEVTIVGFTPKRPFKSTKFPGIVGQFDPKELFQAFLGQVDLMIDPVAIYGEVI
ncbi:hypothetical protein SD81_026940 [Tolypothrix campylonemoides VB511288]|nr:hypothetical protein SD81_026940 [Tolypothrix campylonemoides VB511288]